MTIGERLKEERERLGYSQPEFHALGGVEKKNKQTVIQWEKGNTHPNAEFLAAIAAAGADVLYIITGVRAPASLKRSNGATSHHFVAAEPPALYGLTPDEAALLDNYRHSSEEAQAALRATSAALAQRHEKLKVKGGGDG